MSRLDQARQVILQNLTGYSEECTSRMKPFECDVATASEDDLKTLIQKAAEEMPAFDILVNCAGINRDALLIRTSDEDMRDIIDTNLIATMRITKHMVKHMLQSHMHANKSSKSIINIGSVVGNGATSGNVGQCVYSASKSALVGFTKTLAKEVGSRSIRVNLVTPGFIETDMTKQVQQSEKVISQLHNQIVLPKGRFGTPKEVAKVVRFLASDDASYITGQVLNVDGGYSL